MTLPPTLRLRNLGRSIEANVPQKALRDVVNRLRFGPQAPLSDECLWADPRDITLTYAPRRNGARAPIFRRRDSGRVVGGDWDLAVMPVGEETKFAACMAHFREGVPWEETPLWDKMQSAIDRKGIADGCRSEADLHRRYDRLDALAEAAQRLGRLRARRELRGHYFRREHGGVMVHIARDGTLLRTGGGMHRFALARAIDLPLMPVQLGVIHPEALRAGVLRRLRRRPADYTPA